MEKSELAGKINSSIADFKSTSVLVLKILFALLSVPFMVGLSLSLLKLTESLGAKAYWYFISGMLSYALIHLFIYKPSLLYKKGQELLKIIFGFFSPLVKVAPYLLPLYAILTVLLYLTGSFVFGWELKQHLFLFFIAFSLSLHLIFTSESLREKGAGLQRANYYFSFAFIYLSNVIIAAICLHFIFKEFSFLEFLKLSGIRSAEIFKVVFRQLFV